MARDYKGVGNQKMTAIMEIIPSEALNSPVFIDKNRRAVRGTANTLTAREDRDVSNHGQEGTVVLIPLRVIGETDGRNRDNRHAGQDGEGS